MFVKSASYSAGPISVRRYHGTGPLTVQTSRGEVKAFPGDHIVELRYNRAARQGEKGFDADPKKNGSVARTQTLVLPIDLAKAMNLLVTDKELATAMEKIRRQDAGEAEPVEAPPVEEKKPTSDPAL